MQQCLPVLVHEELERAANAKRSQADAFQDVLVIFRVGISAACHSGSSDWVGGLVGMEHVGWYCKIIVGS